MGFRGVVRPGGSGKARESLCGASVESRRLLLSGYGGDGLVRRGGCGVRARPGIRARGCASRDAEREAAPAAVTARS